MNQSLLWSSLVCVSFLACSADAPDDCAFEAQDGSCAVTVSSGALECNLDDAALCDTLTTFLDAGREDIGQTSAALVNTGVGTGTGPVLMPSLVCEPPGTFMCTCCSVKAGCYPCP
jgi:hypothetical protein